MAVPFGGDRTQVHSARVPSTGPTFKVRVVGLWVQNPVAGTITNLPPCRAHLRAPHPHHFGDPDGEIAGPSASERGELIKESTDWPERYFAVEAGRSGPRARTERRRKTLNI